MSENNQQDKLTNGVKNLRIEDVDGVDNIDADIDETGMYRYIFYSMEKSIIEYIYSK